MWLYGMVIRTEREQGTVRSIRYRPIHARTASFFLFESLYNCWDLGYAAEVKAKLLRRIPGHESFFIVIGGALADQVPIQYIDHP